MHFAPCTETESVLAGPICAELPPPPKVAGKIRTELDRIVLVKAQLHRQGGVRGYHRRVTPIRIGCLKTVKYLVQKFGTGELKAREWNHRTRLVVGLWHILCPTGEDPLAAMRLGIKACDVVIHKGKAKSGYHETLTRFYLQEIERFAETVSSDLDLMGVIRALLSSPLADPLVHLSRYTEECLQSEEARMGWVEPQW